MLAPTKITRYMVTCLATFEAVYLVLVSLPDINHQMGEKGLVTVQCFSRLLCVGSFIFIQANWIINLNYLSMIAFKQCAPQTND